jgi:phage protein D
MEFDQDLRERLVQWQYTDKASGGDEGSLTMDNHDLALFDHEAFLPTARLFVQWGYPHDLHPTREIAVEKIKGFRRITVSGSVTEARGLLGVQRTRTFENATEFTVAEEIARSMGFSQSRQREIDQGDIVVQSRGITQAGETDMAFLQRLAAHIGCTVYITGGVFHFHQRRLDQPPSVTLTYFTDREGTIIGEPDIEQSIQGRPGNVARAGHSTSERRTVEGSASNRSDTRRPVLGEMSSVPDPDGFDWNDIVADLGIRPDEYQSSESNQESQTDRSPTTAESDEEAQSQAQQAFRRSERMSVKLSLTAVGNSQIRADTTIRIEGMSAKFSGNYFIEEAVHTVAPGRWTIRPKLSRNATSRAGRGTTNQTQYQLMADHRRAQQELQRQLRDGEINEARYETLTRELQERADRALGNSRSRNNTGARNTGEGTSEDVVSRSDTDPDGQERTRYQSRTGDLPQSRPAEPWDEEW